MLPRDMFCFCFNSNLSNKALQVLKAVGFVFGVPVLGIFGSVQKTALVWQLKEWA